MARAFKIKSKQAQPAPSDKRKLPGETHLQWVQRVTQIEHAAATRTEPLVTNEAQQHAVYEMATVTDSEGATARTMRNRQMSSLALMHERGQLSDVQLEAALQIAEVAERIERAVSTRAHNMEPRVDHAGSGRDPGFEGLTRVRMEKTYSAWRDRLPTPKRLIIDMVLADRGFTQIAQRHRVAPDRAKRLLRLALDRWVDIRGMVYRTVDEDDVARVEIRIERAA